MSDFQNRLAKNAKQRFAWASREKTNAFRVYDLDIPEWPFAVDWYAGFVHVMEYPSRKQRRDGSIDPRRQQVIEACVEVLKVERSKIFTKTHEPKAWGENQYDKGGSPAVVTVEEHGLHFECNLSSYLDAGLFLDHRVMRARVRKEVQGKRFLNLFAYTGSFSVHARAGGAAATTTVDLSNTYCDWAERNLALNGFKPSSQHAVLRADVLEWLGRSREQFDLIMLDPPSFSASKKMTRSFDVQRDHPHLLEQALNVLAPGGTLYFSTNFLGFTLDEVFHEARPMKSIPPDFRRDVHQCWALTRD